jgi:DNA invertase Pin-like site-specific DNA recombinase
MLIGYARVSTADQSLDLQLDALRQCGAERVFSDVASGKRDNRPGLTEALAALKAGDVLVVWKLDRLGRSLKHLVETVAGLQERGVGLKVLTGGIDTTSAAGRLIFGIFAALAEFERELIRERTLAGWPQQGHVWATWRPTPETHPDPPRLCQAPSGGPEGEGR